MSDNQHTHQVQSSEVAFNEPVLVEQVVTILHVNSYN